MRNMTKGCQQAGNILIFIWCAMVEDRQCGGGRAAKQ
jgi:hypothetical protein